MMKMVMNDDVEGDEILWTMMNENDDDEIFMDDGE